MSDNGQNSASAETVEDKLRADMAHGDAIIATTGPVLHHLLVNDDQTLFSDEVVARVRGMMADIARQLLFALAEQIGSPDRAAFAELHANNLAVALLGQPSLLSYAHALTIEAQIADRLGQRSGIDSVLSPLLQELAASPDTGTAGSAMRVLASQARFMQQQRRMSLPLGELPEDLFDLSLVVLRGLLPEYEDSLPSVEARLREDYEPDARRVSQIAGLVKDMQHEAERAIDVDHAGVAIFASALSMASGQARDIVIQSLSEKQAARLALSLLATGMGHHAVEDQFLFLHPDLNLPEGFDTLTLRKAAAMLESAHPTERH